MIKCSSVSEMLVSTVKRCLVSVPAVGVELSASPPRCWLLQGHPLHLLLGGRHGSCDAGSWPRVPLHPGLLPHREHVNTSWNSSLFKKYTDWILAIISYDHHISAFTSCAGSLSRQPSVSLVCLWLISSTLTCRNTSAGEKDTDNDRLLFMSSGCWMFYIYRLFLSFSSSPLSSMVFGTNALFTKPAQSLAPMMVLNVLNQFGYEQLKDAERNLTPRYKEFVEANATIKAPATSSYSIFLSVSIIKRQLPLNSKVTWWHNFNNIQ